MQRLNLVPILMLLVAATLTAPVTAVSPPQTNGKTAALTTAPKDDLNFDLMGEFIGSIKTTKGSEPLGLQIRPTANDQFEAIAYFGGLPGQKRHKPEPIRMVGKRFEEFVVLSGGPWAIFVEKDSCKLIDKAGEQVGKLKRIKRRSPTLNSPPPEGSTVLFDGTHVDQFTGARITTNGLLMEGAVTKPMFQDFNLHLEFRLPYMPTADGQKRSNSGVYLQSRYECQILDSFGTTPLINGMGALYQFRSPDLSMCFPPLAWQTYDIQFTSPRWSSEGTKIRDAYVTSWVNGIKVQDNVALPNKTGAGMPEEPVLLPIKFQDHGDPVRFRNIWIVDRGLDSPQFPIRPTKQEMQQFIKAEQLKKREQAKAARLRAKTAREEKKSEEPK